MFWALRRAMTEKVTALHAIDDGNGGIISGELTVGPDGALYGTTAQGSTAKYNCGGTGCGTVFKFDPKTLKFTVLHSFTGGADGGFPEGSTAVSPNGEVLYGVTVEQIFAVRRRVEQVVVDADVG